MKTGKLIVISPEHILPGETAYWIKLLNMDIYALHIRKPHASNEELAEMLSKVPGELKYKIVLHRHIDLAKKFGLGGIHLPYSRNEINIENMELKVSISAHSWDEIRSTFNEYSYYFISPVFSSISKNGYLQNDTLKRVPADCLTKKIFALGGIYPPIAASVLQNGYAGVAALGYIWKEPGNAVDRVNDLLKVISKQKETA